MNDDPLDMRMHLLHEARDESFVAGQAVERQRCIKVLADLRDDNRSQVGKQWLATAIAALSEAPTPPVASSPVGGEQ